MAVLQQPKHTELNLLSTPYTHSQTKIYVHVSFHCSQTFCKYKLQNTDVQKMFKIRCNKYSPNYFPLGFKVRYKHGIIFRMQQCSTMTKRHQSEVVPPMGHTRPLWWTSRTIHIEVMYPKMKNISTMMLGN